MNAGRVPAVGLGCRSKSGDMVTTWYKFEGAGRVVHAFTMLQLQPMMRRDVLS